MDALRDIQSVVQIAQEEDRLRNFRYDGSVCSDWSEPHPFIGQCNFALFRIRLQMQRSKIKLTLSKAQEVSSRLDV